MNERNTQGVGPKQKDYFFQIQGLKSFCKAKNDWIRFERIHLSFVQHTGKPKCEQTGSIEGALKLHGADGALHLANMILSGELAKKAAQSKAQANGSYPQAVFVSLGGTPAARSKTGSAVFRQFSVSPGSKSDYVFTMSQCDGEETQTGGISPKKGAQRTNIFVPLSSGDLRDFAQSVIAEYTAYRTAFYFTPNTMAESQQTETGPSTYAHQSLPSERSDLCAIVYDTAGCYNNGTPQLFSIQNLEKGLQEITKILLASEKKYVASKQDYSDCIELIRQKKEADLIINYKAKNTGETCQLVVMLSKPQ